MGLLSIFQRQTDSAAESPAAEPDAVAAARTRARRRLIGAAVLLGIGVVGFPLLFETQPRPVPVNIPIEIPRKDGAPPLAPPRPSPALSAASAAVVVADAEAPPARPPEITERAADAGREVPAPAPVDRDAVAAAAKPPAAASRPAPPASRPAAPPTAAATTKPDADADADGARARALLNGQPASAAAAGRVVVQVGAYVEPAKLKDARQKLEAMGFKTYTQVVEVDGTKRTRVRVGPFASKAEADQAAARIKASGLPVAILTL
jgi:DedD protein